MCAPRCPVRLHAGVLDLKPLTLLLWKTLIVRNFFDEFGDGLWWIVCHRILRFWWNWGVQAFVALATFLAVFAALFGNWFQAKIWPSALSLSLKDSTAVSVPTILELGGGTTHTYSRWYHICVENKRRWIPEKDVRVFLESVEEPNSSGAFQAVWLGDVPLRWAHQTFKPFALTIGAPDIANLCSVTKNQANADGPHWLELHPLFAPFALKVRWEGACKLALTLQARSLAGDSRRLRVEICWDGEWADDAAQMKRHLTARCGAVGTQ